MRLPDLTMGEHLPERTAGTPVVVRYDSPSDGEPVGHEPLSASYVLWSQSMSTKLAGAMRWLASSAVSDTL